jgi:thymidylate kinase
VRQVGRLFVFEGPDGVGKTELSEQFTALLNSKGIRTQRLSFPGKEDATLGKLVYDLHHGSLSHGVARINPMSMQLMHIAAHLDVIESTILPALRAGICVVLDRFWWSTKVYGLASGINSKVLSWMIHIEIAAWEEFHPAIIFLIRRKKPVHRESKQEWDRWRDLYADMVLEDTLDPVVIVDNDGSVQESLSLLISTVDGLNRPRTQIETSSQLTLQLVGKKVRRIRSRVPTIASALSPAVPTAVYDTYWRFAAERQDIFFRRLEGHAPPWTTDSIFSEFKFTNAYRASDRVSQFLIKDVIYQGDQSEEELFFRTILFKLFNKIETWRLLEANVGQISYRDFDYDAYDAVLSRAINGGTTIYSAAYIMPSGSKAFGTTRKHRSHLRLLQQMMEDELPLQIADSKTMLEAFTLLRSYPMIGDFLAYQYVTDLNYSTLIDFSEMQFVVPGPGAKGGISKCFASLGGLSEADIIRVVADRQEIEFERLGINFKSLWGRPLQLIDCQNLFCEVDKYSRVFHPEITGSSLRTRIKQKFRATSEPIDYWYPPKWGINEKLAQQAADRRQSLNISKKLT